MRILFTTDGIYTPSGFGNVVKNIVLRLVKDENFEVALQSWQHVGNKISYEGVTIYPNNRHTFGADILGEAIKDFKPDILISLGDFWMCRHLCNDGYQKLLKDMNITWIWYIPIDSSFVPENFVEVIKKPDIVVSMARHGEKALNDVGVDNTYIPHGVDSNIYKPLSKDIREDLKKESKMDGKFIVGNVNRNQDRKQHPRLARAFSLFAKDKEDVRLHFHCDPLDSANMVKGFNGESYPTLLGAISHYGVGMKTSFTKGINSAMSGLSVEKMNEIYNMFDIHASSSSGEGFGLSIIESMSCGIPNIITNFTTAEELVKGRGEVVDIDTFIYGSYGTLRAIVNEQDMANKIEKLYNDWKHNDSKLINDYSKKCRELALSYDWDIIVEQWKKLLLKVKK